MKTVTIFNRPETIVELSSIKFNNYTKSGVLRLKTKDLDQDVNFVMSKELYDWFTKLKPVYIEEMQEDGTTAFIKTEELKTGYQKFMNARGSEYKHKDLANQVFSCPNNSPEYYANPFRLAMLGDTNILTLVNVPTKKVTKRLDPQTGEITVKYTTKYGKLDGKRIKAFIKREKYTRLVIKEVRKVK